MDFKTTVLILSVFLFGCKKANERACAKSIGKIITEERVLSSFQKISIYDGLEIIIKQGFANKIELNGGSNILPHIETVIQGDSLIIRDLNRCDWLRTYKNPTILTLTLQNLETINQYGTGNISILDSFKCSKLSFQTWFYSGKINFSLKCNDLQFRVHSGGGFDAKIEGESKNIYLFINGNGRIDVSSLKCNSSHFVNKSTGNISYNQSDTLLAEIRSSGNILYNKAPLVLKLDRTGSGNLLPK